MRYAYDELSQLILEKDSNQEMQYQSNSHYNRLEKNEERSSFNELDELQSQGAITYEYDLNGNMIVKETPEATFHFMYDALNRLILANY